MILKYLKNQFMNKNKDDLNNLRKDKKNQRTTKENQFLVIL